jgi:hypothetical protein
MGLVQLCFSVPGVFAAESTTVWPSLLLWPAVATRREAGRGVVPADLEVLGLVTPMMRLRGASSRR